MLECDGQQPLVVRPHDRNGGDGRKATKQGNGLAVRARNRRLDRNLGQAGRDLFDAAL
jgi:hypothetical protein